MSNPENPYAFPQPLSYTPCGQPHIAGEYFHGSEGMLLRDWFATFCPESEITEPDWAQLMDFLKRPRNTSQNERKPEWAQQWRAGCRYRYADAMLAERSKQ